VTDKSRDRLLIVMLYTAQQLTQVVRLPVPGEWRLFSSLVLDTRSPAGSVTIWSVPLLGSYDLVYRRGGTASITAACRVANR